MARDEITVALGVEDATKSVEISEVTKQAVTVANGILVKKALDNKNNSLFIVVEPSVQGNVIIKAGNRYPNAMLGDLVLTPTANKANVYNLEDASRFENTDGSILIDFGTAFVGSIYAIAKRAGIKPVE